MTTKDKLIRWGWTDPAGRSLTWFAHQRNNHDEQFAEIRERKQGPKKFSKKDSTSLNAR